MNNEIIRFLLIPIIIFIVVIVVNYIRNKIYKPKYKDNVQKPGKFGTFIVRFLIFLECFIILFTVIGILSKEKEMALVFGVMALIFLVAIIIVKRAYDTSYEENTEYFILKLRDKEYQVYYENIVDWQPSYNEIAILDETRSDKKYVKVNIRIFKPEILLRNIADMGFAGKFNELDHNREFETVYYLVDNYYGYLVEDYVKELESKHL